MAAKKKATRKATTKQAKATAKKAATNGGLTTAQLNEVVDRMKKGATLKAEKKRLGVRGRTLRKALVTHLGSADAYRKVLFASG